MDGMWHHVKVFLTICEQELVAATQMPWRYSSLLHLQNEKKKKRRNMLHNLYDLVYNCAVCENNPITPTVQPRGRWPTYTHKRHAFFVFRSRKKARIKERVLFNAFSLLCSALFWKIKVSCFKMALPKYQINISISQQVSLYNC